MFEYDDMDSYDCSHEYDPHWDGCVDMCDECELCSQASEHRAERSMGA